jgi:uncharacterized membrane protein
MILAVGTLVAIVLVGIPRLKRTGDRRTVIVYAAIYAVAFVCAILYKLGNVIYGPMEWLMHLVRVVFNISLRALCGDVNGV